MKVLALTVVSLALSAVRAADAESKPTPSPGAAMSDAKQRVGPARGLQFDAADSTGVQWKLVSRISEVPRDAIRAGFGRDHDSDVANYIGRVFFNNAVVPSRISKPERDANSTQYQSIVAWESATVHHDVFEIACANPRAVRWVPATNGRVPRGAVVAGVTAGGGPLYVCRVFDNSIYNAEAQYRFMMEPGVLDPYSGVCLTELWGIRSFPTYEVLVIIS